jgi:hypothetical protein
MNSARTGASLCYVTASNTNKTNRRRAATPYTLDKIARKSLNDSINEGSEIVTKREI